MTISGSVSSFSAPSVIAGIAEWLGINTSAVGVQVMAGSVQILVTVTVADAPQAESVRAVVAAAAEATASGSTSSPELSSLSSAMSASVEQLTTPTVFLMAPPSSPPSPPTPPPEVDSAAPSETQGAALRSSSDDGLGGGGIAGIVIAVLAVAVVLGCFVLRGRGAIAKPPASSDAYTAAITSTAATQGATSSARADEEGKAKAAGTAEAASLPTTLGGVPTAAAPAVASCSTAAGVAPPEVIDEADITADVEGGYGQNYSPDSHQTLPAPALSAEPDENGIGRV